jgi:hypothetical protein
LPAGVSFDGAKVDTKFDYANAEVDYWKKAIPGDLEVTRTMAELKISRLIFKRPKSSLNECSGMATTAH